MRVLFAIGIGIMPEQRIRRWQMVSRLYAALGKALNRLGHQTYFYVHPEALTEDVPIARAWISPDHEHLNYILDRFAPDFVFTWNGSSVGDEITASIVEATGAKMVYSEQGWFPQADTIYFDFAGCNGSCSTKNRVWPEPPPPKMQALMDKRREFIASTKVEAVFDRDNFRIAPVPPNASLMVPLQDERDLNILLDSPFKTMDAFVGYLSRTYPQRQFLVRPHPKFPNPVLSDYPNIEMATPKISFYEQLAKCNGVVGINSTTLLESALLGYTVFSYGTSLASGTGLFVDLKPDQEIEYSDQTIDMAKATGVLHHLLCEKQMLRADLDNPQRVMKSSVFNELLRQLTWNPISR